MYDGRQFACESDLSMMRKVGLYYSIMQHERANRMILGRKNCYVTRIDAETKNNYFHMFTYEHQHFYVVRRPEMATKNSNCTIQHFDV